MVIEEERGSWEQRGRMASEAEMGRPRISSSSEIVSQSRTRSCNRGHWRPAEDEKLLQLVKMYGPQNWNFMAEHLDRRSGKSCRLRWYNQLEPNISKKPFTDEEEEMLLALHKVKGNKWAAIARYFPGKTDNAVKNHFHVLMSRRKREKLTLLNGVEVSFNNNINYYSTSDSISSSITSSRNTNIMDSGAFNLQKYQNIGGVFGMSISSPSTIPFITSEASASGGDTVSKPQKDSSAYCYTPAAASFMLGSYHSFTAPGVPSIGNVVPLPCNLSNSSYGHRTDLELMQMRTKTSKQKHHQSLQQKSIPLIDFLGVGTSSANDNELSIAQPISDRQVQ